ncbi:1452_t:CDS:1, partial [Ambispora leptoticha]
SKELIEKQIKSQKSSSQASSASQPVRKQLSGESQLKAQQQHVNLPPRKSPH